MQISTINNRKSHLEYSPLLPQSPVPAINDPECFLKALTTVSRWEQPISALYVQYTVC